MTTDYCLDARDDDNEFATIFEKFMPFLCENISPALYVTESGIFPHNTTGRNATGAIENPLTPPPPAPATRLQQATPW